MSGSDRFSILLVDDHPMLRLGLRQLIELQDGLRIAGEAASGAEALALVPNLKPDLVVLDNNMPGMTGLETLRRLRAAGYTGKILLYTVSDAGDDVRDAMRHGANGYLLKDMNPREVLAAIQRSLRGEVVISDRLAACLDRSLAAGSVARAGNLTTREREVLAKLASGSSNRIIGEQLGISEETVRVHVKNLFNKIGVHTRVEAVVWAMERMPH